MKTRLSHNNVHYATDHDEYNLSLEDDGHQWTMIEKQNLKGRKLNPK
jgi:hypothetical protein